MMRGIVRRVVAFLRRHLFMIILGTLVLLAIFVVLWRFPAWLTAPAPPVRHAAQLAGARILDVVAVLQQHLLLVGALGLGLLVLLLWKLPRWQASGVQEIKDRLTIENAARQTLAQIVGGAVLIAGLFFTWANLKITQDTATKSQETATKSLELAREGQITDRYTKAIEQLGAVNQTGNKKLEVRLGGIYALERIARESAKDHWPIMEVLTAYVRETAPWLPKEAQPSKGDQGPQEEPPAMPKQPLPKLAADIQAILTVLRRRTHTHEKGEEQQLNLAKTALGGAFLGGAQLEGAILGGAQLEGANLIAAQLEGAILEGAQLQGAILIAAQLEGAILEGAQLQGAFLLNAQLKGANLQGAQLEGADLQGAQLQGAFLRDAQLEGAFLIAAQLEGAILIAAQLKGANLQGAQLEGANLQGAQLQGARDLTIEQLCTTAILYQARIDPPLLTQIQKQCPQLLEKPSE